ncbi:glycoside hydrolase family protein [Brevundimonas sp.]|uniref:glycoside hydrolase family protein n=1 Tax=Brevundimonas sp. TaxID=1871086 RepID=UPI002FD99246
MSDVTPNRMKISREGIVLIKSFEGFRPRAVARGDGWVIGYGHTASARDGLTVGEADAELLLQYDLIPVAKALHERVTAPLNQHQFDALASFAFSLGVERFATSDVLARVNAGAAAEAADALFGWPETPGPDAALRRRAAERALFVAAPEAAVTLADLLAAPLPLPISRDDDAPETPSADARAAAVAHLLGEAETTPETDAPAGEAPAVEAPRPPRPVAAAIDPLLQRYSPYHAAAVGPLPALDPQRILAAVDLSLVPAAPEPAPQAEPANDLVETAFPAAEDAFVPPVEAAPIEDAVASEAQAEPALPEPAVAETAPEPVQEAVAAPAYVEPLIIEPSAPEPLVLTPLTEAETVFDSRPLWTPEQRTFGETVTPDPDPLFEDGGDATLGPILRHETDEEAPGGFDWSETGAFLAMGGIGLVSFGAAMAAFRRAGQEGSGGDQTALIGWVLAVIALVCVGVSSFNLYQRLGRAQPE